MNKQLTGSQSHPTGAGEMAQPRAQTAPWIQIKHPSRWLTTIYVAPAPVAEESSCCDRLFCISFRVQLVPGFFKSGKIIPFKNLGISQYTILSPPSLPSFPNEYLEMISWNPFLMNIYLNSILNCSTVICSKNLMTFKINPLSLHKVKHNSV